MILRLSGADFSKNNIGKIRIIKELTYETKQLLSKYSRSLSDTQKFAVQDFIEGLKLKGIWAYLGNLYMPILAGNLNETMINVKTMTNDYANPDSNYYAIGKNGGLTTTQTSDNIPVANRITVKLNASQLNHHMMVFPLMAYGDSGDEGLFWLSRINAQRTIDLSSKKWKTNSSDNNGKIFDSSGQPIINSNGKVLIGLDFLSDKPYGVNDTVAESKYTGGYAVGLTDDTYTNEPVHILSNYNRRATNEYGLISLGTGIPVELLDVYGDLVKKFFDVMITSSN